MPKQITIGDVDQAEAALAEAKKGKDRAKRQAAMDKVAEIRSAYRLQEEQAGRRVGMVGGDAKPEG